MELTQNQKIALNDLKNVTGGENTLTSQGASIIISMLCDLNSDIIDLKDKLRRRNALVTDLRGKVKKLEARNKWLSGKITHKQYRKSL